MALSLSGSGTPPLSWEGGSRGRRPFQTTTCLLGLMEWGWGGSSFLPELEICPSPQPPSGPHPHQQRQFQSTPAPAPPLQKKNHKRYLSSFPFAGAKGPGTPLPPSQSSGGQRVPLETTSWCQSVCGGRGLCVSAPVSYVAVGGPDTCAWCACVRMSWCAPVWGFLCVCGSLIVCPWVSVSPRVPVGAFLRACISSGVCPRVCVCPCTCHHAWAPRRSNPPPGNTFSWAFRGAASSRRAPVARSAPYLWT